MEDADVRTIIISVVLVFFIGFFLLSGWSYTGMAGASLPGKAMVNPLWFLPAIAVFALVTFFMWKGEHVFKRR